MYNKCIIYNTLLLYYLIKIFIDNPTMSKYWVLLPKKKCLATSATS